MTITSYNYLDLNAAHIVTVGVEASGRGETTEQLESHLVVPGLDVRFKWRCRRFELCTSSKQVGQKGSL